jgi:hypothetical protein
MDPLETQTSIDNDFTANGESRFIRSESLLCRPIPCKAGPDVGDS